MLKRGRWAMAAIGGALALTALSASPAAADHTFCVPGNGPGQCQAARGVAVDEETGQVYVADRSKGVIQVFDENGVFERTIGDGVLSNPVGVAVDNIPASPTRHQIAVTDAVGNEPGGRVLRFDPSGSLRLGLGSGVRDGAEEAQTCGPEASPPTAESECLPGLSSKGECQLFDSFVARSTVAIGPGGRLYVTDNVYPEGVNKDRVEVFAPDGSCLEERVVSEGEDRTLNAIAVDSEEGVYVSVERGVGEIRKLDTAGGAECEIDVGTSTTALAVDPASDRLYAGQAEPSARGAGFPYGTLTIYEPGCVGEEVDYVRRYGYGSFAFSPQGIGALPGVLDPSREGEAAISESKGFVFHLDEPSPGPLLVPGSLVADPVSNTKATLGAEVNPEGKASEATTEFIEKAACEANEAGGGECFDGAGSTSAPLPGEGFKLVGEEALFGCPDPLSEAGHPGKNAYEAGECLTPETTYRFRASVSNAVGSGNSPVDGGEFTTRPWLELGLTWASGVGAGSAQLNAEVNPLGVPVSGHFEVVPEAACVADPVHCFEHAERTPTIDFGGGEAFMSRGISVGGLKPGTTYRYRLIAENPFIAGKPFVGQARSFTTFAPPLIEECPENAAFRGGPGALLPDCRGYEMVSPLDKEQADITVLPTIFTNTPAALEQSSLSGSRLAYGSLHAFGDAASAPWTSQYIAERHPRGEPGEGWSTHSIDLPIERPIYDGATAQVGIQPQAFSPDLCTDWMRSIAEPPLAPGAQVGYPNLYVRNDELCGGPVFETLTTREWGNLEKADGLALALELQGVSADQRTAAFAAPDSLKGTDAPDLGGGKLQLYVWQKEGGGPVFACILPGGAVFEEPCSAGSGPGGISGANVGLLAQLQGALSESGKRLFWTAGQGEGPIYLRENPALGRQPGKECGPGRPCTIEVSKTKSRFRAAAADGSAVIYTSGTDLSRAGIGETAGRPVLSATKKLAGGVLGVMGVSEDASHVYFASTEAIGVAGTDSLGEKAKAGDRNLYLYDEGSYDFIGVLAEGDLKPNASPLQGIPSWNLARVSGTHAAFVSSAPLTGYDNLDATSGERDSEVYLYDAGADRLICASCNPSGARPAGRENTDAVSIAERIMIFGPEWIAGWIGGHETNLYASRELSSDGQRLFFNSTDALVSRDTNGRVDVYEWEAPGEGSCTPSSPSYSLQNGGCVELISSGQSARDSEFVDASPSGDDVFFATLSNLVAADYDLVDIYDARVGGGFPPPPAPPAECEGEACQSPPPAPPAPAPASAGYPANDNVPKGRKCPKGRHRIRVRRGGKSRCVKRGHGKSRHRHAHRRHGRRHR